MSPEINPYAVAFAAICAAVCVGFAIWSLKN